MSKQDIPECHVFFLSALTYASSALSALCRAKGTLSKSVEKSVNRKRVHVTVLRPSAHTCESLCMHCVLSINWLEGCHAFHPMVSYLVDPVFLYSCIIPHLPLPLAQLTFAQVHSLYESFVSTLILWMHSLSLQKCISIFYGVTYHMWRPNSL